MLMQEDTKGRERVRKKNWRELEIWNSPTLLGPAEAFISGVMITAADTDVYPLLDLGIYFGEDEDDEQMEQGESDQQDHLSYLVVANDQDDTFDNVDTESLLVEITSGNVRTCLAWRRMWICLESVR
jgi:hypothetical protein